MTPIPDPASRMRASMADSEKSISAATFRQRLRQLDLLFEYSCLPQWLMLLATCGVVALIWEHGPQARALGWLVVVCLLMLLRIRLSRCYQRSPPDQRLRPHWPALFYMGNVLSGLTMGLVHVLLVPVDTFNLQAGAYAITTGVILCVSIIYAQRFSAFLTFALPSWLPPTLFLLMQDDPTSPYWGLMGVTLFSCMLLAAAFINRSARHTLQSDIRNEALLYRLDEARQQAETLNTQLTGEIQQRRQAEQRLRDSHAALEHRVAQRTNELQQTEGQLRYLSNHDSLTHLANRSLFTSKLGDAIAHARAQSSKLALLHIDLDRFKNINDTLGHVQADALLREVADRLNTLLPNAFILARLGADEFVVVKQNRSPSALAELARRLLKMLGEPVQIGNTELIVSASIGISQFPAQACSSLQLINQANQAMQHAKHLGGNGFHFYSTELPARNTDRLRLENELRKAITDGQLQVHYQPKLHLASGSIGSAEALVRWQHPTRGTLLPGEFIAIAEETGLILALGEQVLHQACVQASQWLHEGPMALRVAVNMSVQQLRQPQLAAQIEKTLQATGLPAHLLELELTESMLLEHSDTVAANIAALQKLGVELSVDDFGTGYSSLAYLRRFPLRSLKIDRAFICDLDEQPRDAAIVRAIIAMAHSMNLRVVAEGVEQESQLAFLRSQGCDEVQGFLISKPVSAQVLTQLLQSRLYSHAPETC